MNKKLLLCSVISPRIALEILVSKASALPFCEINIGRVGYEMKRVVVTGMDCCDSQSELQ